MEVWCLPLKLGDEKKKKKEEEVTT